jgi:hypothetical protein
MKLISLAVSPTFIRNKTLTLPLVQPSAARPSSGKDPALSVPFSRGVWLFRKNNAVHKIQYFLINRKRFCQYETEIVKIIFLPFNRINIAWINIA